MRFKTNAKKVFIDTSSAAISTDEMLDIVLSPAFYWVKKIHLPRQSLRDVKKLLPSLFEDTLPEGTYSYHAYKKDDDYVIFAYDDTAVLAQLAEKDISPAQINQVYFSQSEFEDEGTPISLDGNNVMLYKDGIMLILPAALAEEAKPLHLDQNSRSKQRVELARYRHIADAKSLTWFIALGTVLIILFTMELGMTSAQNGELSLAKEALVKKYELKPTMLQNRAVLNRLEGTHTQQIKIRQVLARIFELQLQKGELMVELSVKKNGIFASFKSISDLRKKQLADALKKEGFKIKKHGKSAIWKIEVVL